MLGGSLPFRSEPTSYEDGDQIGATRLEPLAGAARGIAAGGGGHDQAAAR
jgi:hypothetical protein